MGAALIPLTLTHRTSLLFPAPAAPVVPSAAGNASAAAVAVAPAGGAATAAAAAECASGLLQRVSLVAAKLQQLEARRGFTGSAKPVSEGRGGEGQGCGIGALRHYDSAETMRVGGWVAVWSRRLLSLSPAVRRSPTRSPHPLEIECLDGVPASQPVSSLPVPTVRAGG